MPRLSSGAARDWSLRNASVACRKSRWWRSPPAPWLTLEETNRLIRQQGLSLAVAQAWVLDEVVSEIALPAAEEKRLIRNYMEQQKVSSDDEVAAWLQRKRLTFEDLRYFATKGQRLQRWLQRRYGEEAELRFLDRKLDLDQVVYSILQVGSQDLAEELHQRLREGKPTFLSWPNSSVKVHERESRGQVGSHTAHRRLPELVQRLRISQPGQLWPPFRQGERWSVMRFEQILPAQLDPRTRGLMMEELFQGWFKERVQIADGRRTLTLCPSCLRTTLSPPHPG